MKQIFLLSLLALAPVDAVAQEPKSEPGFDLMQEGLKLFFKGLQGEVEPLTEGLKDFALDLEPTFRELSEAMGPAVRDLADRVDDFRYYDAPEILPNGDIIIRRKPTAPELPPPEKGQIDI